MATDRGCDGLPSTSPRLERTATTGALWVAAPDARHSRNLAARPELAIVIFDSGRRPRQRGAGLHGGAAEAVPAPTSTRASP